jgi:hypothetical protein
MNRFPVRRYERIFEKKALFFRKHFGSGAVAAYKISLFSVNLAKTLIWLVLWVFGKHHARDEVKTHWNMVQRALFF